MLLRVLLVAALAQGLLAASPQQDPGTSPVLAAAREALGGEKKLAAVTSFVARGRTRQLRGNNVVPIEFEIACVLPDKFVRTDEVPAQESGPTSTGFNGESLIQLPPPEPPPPGARPGGGPAAAAVPGPTAPPRDVKPAAPAPGAAPPAPAGGAAAPPTPPDPRKARVTSAKQDFARLTLGMFATSFSSYPLVFTPAGKATAPQGQADVLDVKGPGNLALKLLVDSESHLPIMVMWTTPATNVVLTVPGQPAPDNLPPGSVAAAAPAPPAPTAPKEEQDKYAKDLQDLRRRTLASARVEHRIYYGDYRDIGNGIKFPFRLRRAIGGETTEETNFDEFKINSRIDARRFEALK